MPTPTFNKYKSTTIFGNLSVRDLTNSSGSSVVEVASTDMSGNFLSRGDSTFTKAVVCNALLADINANNKLTTKQYVDSVATGGSSILGLNNTWSGTNSFSNTVQFGNGFNQDGNDINYLDNLTIGGAFSFNNLVLAYNTGLEQPASATATNTLLNLTLKETGLKIKDGTETIVVSIVPLGITQTTPEATNTYYGESIFNNQMTVNNGDITITNGVITTPFLVNKSTTDALDTYTNTVSLTSLGNDLTTNNLLYTFTQNSAQQTYTSAINVNQQVLQSITNFTAGDYTPSTVNINCPLSIQSTGTINVGTSISFTIAHTITAINAKVYSNGVLQNTITGSINSSNSNTRTITCSFSTGGNKSFNINQYFYNYTFTIDLSAYATGTLTVVLCPTISTTMTVTAFSGNYNFQVRPVYFINTTTSTITDTGTTANRTISYSPNSNGTGYSAISIASASSTATYYRGLTTGTTYFNKIYTNGINQNINSTTTNTLNNLTTNSLTCNTSFNLLPSGMVIQYTGVTVPTGWLFCNGDTYNASSFPIYQPLFNVIGIQFGGTNNTNFKVPDYRGAFLRGNGSQAGGSTYVSSSLNTSQNHATQTHSHGSTQTNHSHGLSQTQDIIKFTGSGRDRNLPFGSNCGGIFPSGTDGAIANITISDSTTTGTRFTDVNETRPFNFSVNYLIKY